MRGTDLFMNWIVCCSAKALVTVRRTAEGANAIIVTGAGPKMTCRICLKAKFSDIYLHGRDPIYTPLVFVAISASMAIGYLC